MFTFAPQCMYLIASMGAKNSTPVLSDSSKKVLGEAKSAPLVMFTKHHCGYCTRAKNELQEDGIPFTEKNLETIHKENPAEFGDYLKGLIDLTHQKTVPQIFVCGKFVGGYTEMHAIRANLARMVEQCHIGKDNSSKL